MSTIRVVLLALLAVPLVWLGSGFVYETWDSHAHRFRLTIEVDTPAGVRSASSVIRVAYTGKASWVPQTGGAYASARGEAVFVDLGEGRHVIALLAFGPNGADQGIERLAANAFRRDHAFWYREAPSWTGTVLLPANLIPTLVTFGDLNDPKSARVVRPDMLEQVFGQGVRFRRAFIEMVPAGTWPFTWIGWPPSLAGTPVTRGIEGKIRWIGDYPAETAFERRLRETGGAGGGSLTPGRNLRRGA